MPLLYNPDAPVYISGFVVCRGLFLKLSPSERDCLDNLTRDRDGTRGICCAAYPISIHPNAQTRHHICAGHYCVSHALHNPAAPYTQLSAVTDPADAKKLLSLLRKSRRGDVKAVAAKYLPAAKRLVKRLSRA